MDDDEWKFGDLVLGKLLSKTIFGLIVIVLWVVLNSQINNWILLASMKMENNLNKVYQEMQFNVLISTEPFKKGISAEPF